jgi:ABC-type branched-subunit amino acid transport system ATPase component
MLVKKITFTNHEVLGNMEMSFVKSGKTSKTIIFIGECGTGKTTILNSISEITQAAPEGYLGNHPHLEAEITIELENELDDNINYQNAFREKYIQNNSGKEIVHNGIWLKFCNSTPLGNIMNPKKLHNKIISVQPEAIFIPVDNFKKLISMDNAIAAASYREGKVLFDELAHSPNMINFINAYKFYFPDIRIELEKNELIIKKNNKVLEYRELSMGERKIIDRGAQILSSGIANPIITLDEPENSLSPL